MLWKQSFPHQPQLDMLQRNQNMQVVHPEDFCQLQYSLVIHSDVLLKVNILYVLYKMS